MKSLYVQVAKNKLITQSIISAYAKSKFRNKQSARRQK